MENNNKDLIKAILILLTFAAFIVFAFIAPIRIVQGVGIVLMGLAILLKTLKQLQNG